MSIEGLLTLLVYGDEANENFRSAYRSGGKTFHN